LTDALVLLPSVWPARRATTVTVIFFPRIEDFSYSFVPDAPRITLPFRRHS
jgi:hypothetical protein